MNTGTKYGSRGNVTILMLLTCLGTILFSLIAFDVAVLLYGRRATQTAADAAVLGALRVVQPLVAQEFVTTTERVVNRLLDEAEDEHRTRRKDWAKSQEEAEAACREAALPDPPDSPPPGGADPPDVTDPPDVADPPDLVDPPPGPPDARLSGADEAAPLSLASRKEKYDACMDSWLSDHPEPKLLDVQREILSREILDEVVVSAILGDGPTPTARQVIDAVLTVEDKLCIMAQNQRELEAAGFDEARKYAQWNGADMVGIWVPHDGKPEVAVEVGRPIPTTVLNRIAPVSPFLAKRSAVATIFEVRTSPKVPGDCGEKRRWRW